MGTNPSHLESPSIPLIKGTCNGKSEKDCVKLNLCRYYTSSTSDLYEFKMFLFYHGNTEEFMLFIRNFNMTLAATQTLDTDAKIHYICTLLCGEALRQFDLFSADVENTETLNVDYYIRGLAVYFSL